MGQITEVHSALFNALYPLYPEIKFWCSFAFVVICGYKGFSWLKSIKTNDLFHIHQSVKSIEEGMKLQTANLQGSMEKQTQTYVNEIKELRADMRSIITGMVAAPKARARRKKKI